MVFLYAPGTFWPAGPVGGDRDLGHHLPRDETAVAVARCAAGPLVAVPHCTGGAGPAVAGRVAASARPGVGGGAARGACCCFWRSGCRARAWRAPAATAMPSSPG